MERCPSGPARRVSLPVDPGTQPPWGRLRGQRAPADSPPPPAPRSFVAYYQRRQSGASSYRTKGENLMGGLVGMLWGLVVLLVVVWFILFVLVHVASAAIHILIVLAIIVAIWNLVARNRTA